MKWLPTFISAGLLAVSPGGLASYIAIATEFTVSETTEELQLHITALNQGDEAALSLQHEAQAGGSSGTGTAVARLEADSQVTSTIALDGLAGLPGQYPVVIKTRYQDANGYPFSALTVGFLDYHQPAVSKILLRSGALTIPANGREELGFTVRNNDDETRELDLRLYLPDELAAANTRHRLTLAPGNATDLTFTVENFSALVGSSYAVALVMQYEDGERHYSNAAVTRAVITEPRLMDARQASVIAGAALVLIAAILATMYVRRRMLAE